MKRVVLLFFWLGCVLYGYSGNKLRVMFYNVENFFDCNDDSLTKDADFLPGGVRGWIPFRFYKKSAQIAQVVAAVGENKFPEIIGLAEVENKDCVRNLVFSSPLKNANYSYVHYESPDPRGIDVCLLYNRFRFAVFHHEPLSICFPGEPNKRTRDVLFVSGKTPSGDTLHLFVCHLPSRLGGEQETEPYRRAVATCIRRKMDSLFLVRNNAEILVMGDFNDFPDNRSLTVDLKAETPASPFAASNLYNLMLPLMDNPDVGTNKYQGNWGILDQILVSGKVLKRSSKAHIFDADFLLQRDDRWMGKKPFRTYNGMTYEGGYSDHLPVYVDLNY